VTSYDRSTAFFKPIGDDNDNVDTNSCGGGAPVIRTTPGGGRGRGRGSATSPSSASGAAAGLPTVSFSIATTREKAKGEALLPVSPRGVENDLLSALAEEARKDKERMGAINEFILSEREYVRDLEAINAVRPH